MTTKLLDYDPNDSGGIATRLPGEDRTVIIRADRHRRRGDQEPAGGEPTKNLSERDKIMAATGRMRHADVVPESLVTGHGYDVEAHSGPIIDLVDTATFHLPDDLEGPQPKPTPPLPKPKADPAETGVNIFGGLGADLPEQPWPVPAPATVRSRCRHKVKSAFRQGVLIGVLVGAAVYSGLVLAALVVVR
jgi:hypothetical protein